MACLERSLRSDLLAEDQVHDFGAARQRRHDLIPVDELRRRCLVVPGQQRDRLHRNTSRRQQRHERMPNLPRHPAGFEPRPAA